MAIKGKSKARGGRRVIAAPPRPTLVVRKPPLWRRRWVWSVLGAIVALAVLAGVLNALHRSHAREFRARERSAILSLTAALQRRFPLDRRVIPPDAIQWFPNLASDLGNLAKGTVKSSDATAEAQRVAASATKAATAVEQMQLTKTIAPTFSASGQTGEDRRGATLSQLQDAQFLMAQAFRAYAAVGNLEGIAATAPAKQRTALANEAQTMFSSAGTLFDRGYRKLLDIRDEVGLQTPNPASGVQPGQPLPTGGSIVPVPSASP